MSQGLTWIAGRRTPLLALVALFALTVGLFAVIQSASAAACSANPIITLGFGTDCTVEHEDFEFDADESTLLSGVTVETADDVTTITVAAATTNPATDGTSKIVLRDDKGTTTGDTPEADDDTIEYEVQVVGFGISKVEIVDDPDGIVSAGAAIKVKATTRSAAAEAVVRLVAPTTGLSIVLDPAMGTTSQGQTSDVEDDGTVTFDVNTAGAPEGEYTLTFTADNDGNFLTRDNETEATKQASATLTVTVGDPGTGIASASLSLGNETEDKPFTADDETKAETDTVAADGGDINVVIAVLNSLGEKASSGAINQVTIIAPGGTITSSHQTGATETPQGQDERAVVASGENSVTLDETDDDDDDTTPDTGIEGVSDVGQRTQVSISKTDGKPGTVSVYALVIGPGGAATTESIVLTFTGAADEIVVNDATKALRNINVDGDDEDTTVGPDDYHSVALQVTATDASGLTADPPVAGVSVVITDADGKRVASNKMTASQPTRSTADFLYYITVTGKGTEAAPLTAGDYTVTAKRGDLEGSGTFVVAGAPSEVDVAASQTNSDTIGDVITVTATVTDEDGSAVPDGTTVMFIESKNTGLAPIGTGHGGRGSKAGSASVKYAVVGAGTSVVSASAGGATGVVVIISTAGEAAVVDEPDPEPVDGLSRTQLNNFASWSGEGSVSASELLAGIPGASGVLYYDGDSWQRYGVVDGQVIPGSRDFTVRDGDVIWISG